MMFRKGYIWVAAMVLGAASATAVLAQNYGDTMKDAAKDAAKQQVEDAGKAVGADTAPGAAVAPADDTAPGDTIAPDDDAGGGADTEDSGGENDGDE